MSRLFPATRRDMRSGMLASQKLLEQAGYIRPTDAMGLYTLLPLGWETHQRICQIVTETMEHGGAQNLQTPVLQTNQSMRTTGRRAIPMTSEKALPDVGRESGATMGMTPTAEDTIVMLAAAEVHSWRGLPLILHQIAPKFRDEQRPKLGLLRTRELILSEAYSFDRDEASMLASFQLFQRLYARIFEYLGLLNHKMVQHDTTEGYCTVTVMLPNDAVDDVVLTCELCGYGAREEEAQSAYPRVEYDTELRPMRREHTPDVTTVEQLHAFFPSVDPAHMVKTVIFTVNPHSAAPYEVAVCIRGDLEVNAAKLAAVLDANEVEAADAPVVRRVTGAEVGFAGPLGLTEVSEILFDRSVEGMTNVLCGCNTTDFHAVDVNIGRDLPAPGHYADLHAARSGDQCASCGQGTLRGYRGIEIGRIFTRQRGHYDALGATYVDESGQTQSLWVAGCRISTMRLMQAIVEASHDQDGIVWPESVAPYLAHILPINAADDVQCTLAEEVEQRITAVGVDVLYDDRSLGGGAKFKDADLIGCPWRVTVGRKAREGLVELRNRRTGETAELAVDALVDRLSATEKARSLPIAVGHGAGVRAV